MKYRFGILGCGAIAHHHAQSIAASGRGVVTAVYGPTGSKAQNFAGQHDIPRWYTRYPELIEDPDVDIVCIATPSGTHAEQVMAAAAAGRHIFCEKPMAITKEELDNIEQAVADSGVKMAVVFQKRLTPQFVKVRQAVEAGIFGDIFLADASMKFFRSQAYYDSASWRGTWALDGGGALMNQGIHTIDQLLCLAGDVESVCAKTAAKVRKIEVEDTAVALLKFTSGAFGVITGTTSVYPGQSARIELHGRNGSVVCSDRGIELWATEAPPTSITDLGSFNDESSTSSDPNNFPKTSHTELVVDLIQAIESGGEPMIPPREGRRAVDLILAIYESARSCREVFLARG